VIVIHSKFRYRGPPKFGGVLQPGDKVLHLVSDAATENAQRAELRAFVVTARLPRSLLNNPHFLKPGRPHLDVWGRPAEKAMRLLATTKRRHLEGRHSEVSGRMRRVLQSPPSSRNLRTSPCIPAGYAPQCHTSGRRRSGAGSEERNGGEEEA
jgi:hypothetical protein